MRRVLPALGLYFLSPLVAEFLLGNIPITTIVAYLAVSTMYGGGALLVRELARRAGYGWPSMITFALAFGVIEESFATMTLFNPNWEHRHQLDYSYLPALGISPPWTLLVLALHTVWSISVPILITETLARSRRTAPWLGKAGLAVAATLFVLGLLTVLASSITRGDFVASPAQYGGAGLAVVAIIAIGVNLGRRRATAPTASSLRAPNPWLVGTVSLAAGSSFMLLYATDPRGLSPWLSSLDVSPWTATVLYLALFTGLAVAISRWSRRTGWSDAHRLALAGGALLTYAWHAFPWDPITASPVSSATDLAGNAILATATIALLITAALRLRHPRR
ncbi:hypothetical protein GUY59_29460 [Nonomuraea sp. K271]|nr:hypothetical protein [Nonomuraea sp. K271]